MVITSAVFGLTTVGSAGAAFAVSDTVGVSPAAKVVKIAPMAVSVTFREPLRARGAQMRVLTADGDVGIGRVSTGQKTLRRALRVGAPAGDYIVEWKAISARGQKMTGTFRFKAARGNGEPVTGPVDSTASGPSPEPMVSASASGLPSATGSPSVSASASASVPASGEPVITVEPMPSSDPSGTPAWISGSAPIWTPSPTATAIAAGSGHGSAHGSDGGSARSVSTGFTAVPLALGGLLVLAAGMVSLVNRPRLRD
jgi:methionine-rich copper-binding protein CopC